jgi:hypothetical protein
MHFTLRVGRLFVAGLVGALAASALAQSGTRQFVQDTNVFIVPRAVSPDGSFIAGTRGFASIFGAIRQTGFRVSTASPTLTVGEYPWPDYFIPDVLPPTSVDVLPRVVLNSGLMLGSVRQGPPAGSLPQVSWALGSGVAYGRASTPGVASAPVDIGFGPFGAIIGNVGTENGAWTSSGVFSPSPDGTLLNYSPFPSIIEQVVAQGGLPPLGQFVIGNRPGVGVVKGLINFSNMPVSTVIPGNFQATCASFNGDVIAGTDATAQNPWVWRGSGAPIALPKLGYDRVTPIGMSADGRTIIAKAVLSDNRDGTLIWRDGVASTLWDVVPLPAPNAANFQSAITALSDDGSTVTGWTIESAFSGTPQKAFVSVLPPLNDFCSTAQLVTYGTTISSTRGANRSLGDFCAAEGTAGDVFFRFIPQGDETVVIDTCGSSYDTTLQVFGNNVCGTTALVLACNDDDLTSSCTSNLSSSRVSVNVFAGNSYIIRVSGWNGRRGAVQLNITPPNRPANDQCNGAIYIDPGFSREFSTVGALTDTRPGCPGSALPFSDVWFTTVAPDFGRMNITTCGSQFNAVIAVYAADACGNPSAQPINCGQFGCTGFGGRVTLPCVPGQQFYIRVGGQFGSQGTGRINTSFVCDEVLFDQYRNTVIPDAPTAFWRFNDTGNTTARDDTFVEQFSCGQYPGVYNGAFYRPDGVFGRALGLGASGSVNRMFALAPSPSNGAVFGAWTMEAWVRSTIPDPGIVLTQRLGDNDWSPTLVIGYTPVLGLQPGRVMFVNDGPGTFTGAISNVRVDDGQWHHIVGVRQFVLFQGWFYSLYVDGVLQGTNNLSGVGTRIAPESNGDNWWVVGATTTWPPASANFIGEIDEVAIYNSVLSAERIEAHFIAGSGVLCDSIDFNRDGLAPDSQDIDDFLAVLSGGPGACSTAPPNGPGCGDLDYNNDGLFPDSLDLDALLLRLSGGPCLRS